MTSANGRDSVAPSSIRGSRGAAEDRARKLPTSTVDAASARDVEAFSSVLRSEGLVAALRFLNQRTSHRFTGVFRFDGDMLRSVAMVDKWLPDAARGDDVPLAQAYCAHLKRTGEPLEVQDGKTDPRTPLDASKPGGLLLRLGDPRRLGRAVGGAVPL